MSPPKLARVVFDTNALISAAIIPGSVSRRALLHAVQNFQLIHSDDTWAELYDVIHRSKFDRYLPGNGRNDFLLAIASHDGAGVARCRAGVYRAGGVVSRSAVNSSNVTAPAKRRQ